MYMLNKEQKCNGMQCGKYFIKSIAIIFVIAVIIFAIYWLIQKFG